MGENMGQESTFQAFFPIQPTENKPPYGISYQHITYQDYAGAFYNLEYDGEMA